MHPDERANALTCTVSEVLFGVGMGLVGLMTVLPLLLKQLGAGEIMLGLAFGIGTAGWGLAQPIGMVLFGRRRRTKRFLIPWSFCCAVPTYLAMGAVVYFIGPVNPLLCAVLVLALFAIRVLGAGMAIPLWFDWQATLFRQEVRGRTIGLMAGAFALGVSLAAVVAGKVRLHLDFPVNYSILFLTSSVFFVGAAGFLVLVREPAALKRRLPSLKVGDLFRRFGQSLRERNFRNYLIGRIILTMGGGAAGFYAVYFKSIEGGALAESTVITLGTFLTLPQAASSYLLGRLGDRSGHKIGVIIGALAQGGSLVVAYSASGPPACAFCFALLGVAWSSSWVSHANMMFETCPHDSRIAHITLSNMVLSPFVLLVPLATGWAMGYVGVRSGIGIAMLPTVLGLAWLLFVVKDPRAIEISRQNPRERVAP